MPPPQPFLSTRLRGHVCKSCLSRLQAPLRRQLPWLTRSYSSDRKPKKKRGAWDIPHGTVRYFEQTPDGVRTEIKDDDDEAFTIQLREQLKKLEKELGKSWEDFEEKDLARLFHATQAEVQGEATLNGRGKPSFGSQMPEDFRETLDAMLASNPELESRLEPLKSLDVSHLSDEERSHLRAELIRSVRAMPPEPPPSSLSTSPPGTRQDLVNSRLLVLPIASFPRDAQESLRSLEESLNDDSIRKARKRRLSRRSAKVTPTSTYERISETWRSYIMARNALISAPHLVPARFWVAIWDILAVKRTDNLDRMAHLRLLGDDMVKSGFDMTQEQKLLYIEATFIEADEATAIQTWQSMGLTSPDMGVQKEYWDLGTRMFCRHGLVDTAVECASNILKITNDPNDFRLLLPIIGAVLKSGEELRVQRAWALYIRFKWNIGRMISMEDYDSLIRMFMDNDGRDQALSIFKDMMLTNDVQEAQQNSISRYTNFAGKSALSNPLQIQSSEFEWRDFSTVDVLPRRFNNRIFFAKWMKKLIGGRELESAEKVYLIMQERGIRPSSISINGLLGAWYREGNGRYREKADALAWQMIDQRQHVVTAREHKYKIKDFTAPLRVVMTQDQPDSKNVNSIPDATIETFSILLEQYSRRHDFGRVPELFEALKRTKLKPNTSFMNQLLLTHTHAESPELALQSYQSLTNATKSKGHIVRPDFETYQILWETLARAFDPLRVPSLKYHLLGSSRSMFASMMHHLKARGGPLPNELYQTIIMSFCIQKDQIGTIVALKTLQEDFGNFPTEVTARAIVLQVARTALTDDEMRAPRRMDLTSKNTQQRVKAVAEILALLKERRAEVLQSKGIELDELQGDAKLKETTVILLQLLKYAYENKPYDGKKTLDPAAEALEKAARKMNGVRWEDDDV